MSGCAVSNRLVLNRSLFCLSMLFLVATLALVPVAKAQDTPSFDGATVANQMYEAGVAIEALELPAATGGSGDLTYNLRPVPPGLEFDAGSRTLSGTPSDVVIFPEKVFFLMTYEVTDADGATAILTFNISVEEEDVAPSFDGVTVADQMFSAGVAIEALELPAASSGNGDLTYNLRPVPPGLAFDAGSRTLSGTPSEVAISLMTYEVTDADGDTATLTFEIEVDTMPSFDGATVADQSYRTGEGIGVLGLPVASSGDGPLVYSLSPEVPGLTFDAGSRTLSGTPTVAGTYELTYRVEDSDTNVEESDAEELTFTVSVELTFAAVAARQTTFTAGEEIKQPWELPVGRSTDALTYSLDGELPPGLVFDAEARTISGMPPADVLYAESYPFTYRAVDSDGDSAELGFTIVVAGMPSFGDQVVEDQLYTAGDEVSLGLPEAVGGNVALTYSLEGELPSGVTFDAEARTVSGTPPPDVLYAEGYAVTYWVADVDGDDAALSFTIVVNGMPSFSGQVVEDQLYTAGDGVSLLLPAAVGGNVALAYTLEGELPSGLAFDAASRTISGTPPPDVLYAEGYAVTYWVADVDGDAVALSFTIVVNGMPSFGDQVVEDQMYTAGDGVSLLLPAAVGGNVALTYTLAGELPAGLEFDGETRTISGTPPPDVLYPTEGYVVTYWVVDVDGDAVELSFAIAVNGMPSFSGQVVEDQLYTAGDGVSLLLPAAVGGNVALTYTLDRELPAGLTFDGETRTISGTPPPEALYDESYALTYRVADVDGDAVELSFTIVVNGMPSFSGQVVEDQLYTAGDGVSLLLPAAVGGNVALAYTLTYSLEGELPAGLAFDAASRTISGTPPPDVLYAEGYAVTYWVADVDGDAVALSFTIVVNGMPSFGDQVVEDQMYTAGDGVSLLLPAAVGGNVALTYTLAGELPAGLEFDGETRTISGTPPPDVLYPTEGYVVTYWVVDVDGDAVALSFAIAVNGMPSFSGQVVEDQLYTAGDGVSLLLPAAVGGNVALTYTLDRELPAGLTFDAASRTISGTPPPEALYDEGYALTYWVADVDGDAVALSFTIVVNGMPSFSGQVVEDQLYTAGDGVSLLLPAAVGGNVALAYTLTYSLEGELPAGLAFDAASRTISGTPPPDVLYAEGYAVTYWVADVDGDAVALSFTIVVNGMPSFGDQVVEDQMYTAGDGVSLLLPAAVGGNVALTYTLAGELPAGLEFDGETRTISGTPPTDALYPTEGYVVTYWVADVDGDAVALSFAIAVNGMPSFSGQVVEDQLYTAGDAMSLLLPAAVGGNVALTYTLDRELPAGLTFDAASRTISGTPPPEALYDESYALTYRVADVDGDAVALSFAIAVNGMPSFSGQVVEDQLYTAGDGVSLLLPAAVGGNVALAYTLTYSLEGELPAGLAFDGETRTISGTPPPDVLYAEGYAVTYWVADVDGDAVALSFTIVVNGMPSFGDQVVEDQMYTAGDGVSLLLPAAVGGNVALTYTLAGELPAGLEFDGETRTISGTPPTDVLYPTEGYVVTYWVADVDGDAVALSFAIAVNGMPSFSGQVVEDQMYTAGDAVSLGLPAAVGGNVALTYTLDRELPAGLTFDGETRTISGTPPPEALYDESYALTYRVADVDGDAVALSFTIVVNGMPSFSGQVVEDQLYTAGDGVSLLLPAAVGGNVALAYTLTYSLEGELPAGLAFDGETRTISGTSPPDVLYAEGYAVTYWVADVDGDAVALSFTIVVNGMPSFGDQVVEDQLYTAGDGVSLLLPAAVGGNVALTYTLAGELPAGLEFDGETRTISGTPPTDVLYPTEGYVVTYWVVDVDGDAVALSFAIAVNGMPSFSGQVVEDQLYTAGDGVSLLLPAAVGGNVALTYTLDRELPAGLEFDGETRTISGTPPPDVLYAAEGYPLTYRVADVDGDAVALTFTIAVNGMPSFGDQVVEDQMYTAGDAVSLGLPAAVGGNVALTYTLDGELPPGLVFDPASWTISGDLPPDVLYAAEAYAFTYWVADVDGDSAELSFTIAVNGMPSFDGTVANQVAFAAGASIGDWVLPSASGGNGALTYSLAGELPPGLAFDAASQTISGDLSADLLYAEGYELTYKVEDEDGDAVELTFTMVVNGMPSFGDQVVEDQMYTAGDEVSLALPVAAGGNVALTYTLDGELPPGLTFDAASQTISGTLPTDALYVEGCVLTYRVVDVDGDSAELSFTIAVNGMPSFGDQVVEDQAYTAGDGVSLDLPEAVGGNVALTYTLDGELPPGLVFDPTSRTIAGTPPPNVLYSAEGYALTYRVADVDGDSVELSFTIAVNGMPSFAGTITNQRVTEGEEMAPLELPAALGGNGELTYSLSPEVPGLTFDAETRTLSGTPTTADTYELTYRVEDSDGDVAEVTFSLKVDGTPAFDTTIEDRILRQNETMDPWELPVASGGNGELTYSLDLNVPGLSFDAASRTLSGTPTDTGVYRLVYQVEDVDGDSAELTFHITIDGAPSFNGTVANQTYIDSEAIEDLVLPLASGGNLLSLNPDGEAVFGELTYTLDNVPPGLTFDPNPMSPMLSGTPMEVGTYTLTYTAHDADDNISAEDAAILSFEVRVEESATDRFAELNEQILSKYALAIADGTNRAIENRLEQMDRVGDVNRSFSFAAESTLHDMIQSGRIFENRPVNMSQVVNGSSFAVPFGFGRGCVLCPGSPTFWGRGDYGQMSSDDGSLDWEGNLTRAQIGLDARPGAEMLTGLALSWAQGSFDYSAPLLGEERVDGTYTPRMLSLHPYVGFSPGRLGVWLTAGLGRGDIEIDDEQGTVGQQSSDTSLRTASVGASGDLLASGPTQLRIKAAATVAQVEIEGGGRIAEQTVSANRLRLALKGSYAYEAGMDGQVTPELEVALRQDGGDGQTGAGVEVGGGLRYEGGGFTLEAMARSLVSDGDDEVEYKEWGAHLLLQRSAGTGGRGLSLRVMPTYGTQANSLTLWERSVAEIADRGAVNAQGQLRAEVGYGLAAPGGRGVYTVYSGMTQAPERMQLRLGTRLEVDSSMSVSLESTRWQRIAGAAEHGLLLRGRLVF